MHSRKKGPKDENKEKERLQKATKFSGALTNILQLKKSGCKDKSLLNGIADLLYVSPDFFSLWNYRREIFIAIKQEISTTSEITEESEVKSGDNNLSKFQEFNKLCNNELHFIENCLKVNYKSYGTWHHRCWLLSFMNEPNFQREIQLCNQFLQMDGRNFHCWNYRRIVVKLANIDAKEELEFTKNKINEDSFSNFSSWYYRSCLLKQLYATGQEKELVQSSIDEDYEQILNAIYTDPTDQSAWLYLRWLFLVYSNGLESLSNSKHLNPSAQIKRFSLISSSNPDEYSFIVELSSYSKHKPNISFSINNQTVCLNNWNATNGFVWRSRVRFPNGFQHEIKYNFELKLQSKPNDIVLKITFNHAKGVGSDFACFNYFDAAQKIPTIKIDSEKYKLVKDLLELEPDNKWVNFTLAWLETNDDLMNSIIDKLIQIDKLRVNYYKDLRSKIVLHKILSAQQNLYSIHHLSLSNLKLHSLLNVNHLMHIQYLDLSHNELIKFGVTFSPLQSLKCLILNYNSIYLIDAKLDLPNLTILSLASNRIFKWHMVEIILSNFSNLKHLILFDNPITVENRLDRSLLQSKVGNRDLLVYLDQTSENKTNISKIIEAEFEVIHKRCGNVVTE